MLFSKRNCVALSLLAIFVAILGSSCKPKPEPKDVRVEKKRAITIVNKTGSDVIYYSVSVASSKVPIEQDSSVIKDGGTEVCKIPSAFKNDLELEVMLADCKNQYVKQLQVPLEGNTDVTITEKDKKSDGWWKEIEKYIIGKCK